MSLRFPLADLFFTGCKRAKPARRPARPRHSVGLSPASLLLEDRRMLSADSLAIWDAEYHEADDSMVFWITRMGECIDSISATFSTSDGTATAGEDYVAQSGVVTFDEWNTIAIITVALLNDTLTEENETFYLDLIHSDNATFDRAQAAGTIYGNDNPPVLEAMDLQYAEEHSWFSFTPIATDIDEPAETLSYSLEGDVPEGASIDSTSGEFTWTPGEMDGGQTFTVTIVVTDSGSKSTSGTLTIEVLEQNEVPTTNGFGFIAFNEDTTSDAIDIYAAFDDVEDTAQGLSYSIVDGVDPSLVKDVHIDSAGQLTIEGAENAFGFGSITIRATDSGGEWVEAVLSFEILAVNDAPVIESFSAQLVDGFWEIFGSVSDVDDSVEGNIVTFGGDFGAYFLAVEIQSDGTFTAMQQTPSSVGGIVTAETSDYHGLGSNVEQQYLMV